MLRYKIISMNKLISFGERILTLSIVCLLLTAGSIYSGYLFGYALRTDPSLKGSQEKVSSPTAEQLALLGLQNAQVENVSDGIWVVKGSQEKGTILSSVPFAKDVKGYAGTTPVLILLDEEQLIQRIIPLENAESSEFFREVVESGLLNRWNRQKADQISELQVNAVSGATYSSVALIGTIEKTLAAYSESPFVRQGQPAIGWIRTLAVMGVVILGLIFSLLYKKNKKVRIIQLILNVGVIGFWCGQFISFSLLRNWISQGFSWIIVLPSLFIVASGIIIPLISKKQFYCTWICPYGSLQELAYKLPTRKWSLSPKVYRFMNYIRTTILLILFIMLWSGVGASFLDYEPFTAFLFDTATPAVILLALAFILTGIFIPKPWCRCCCPVGELFDLAFKK